MKQKIIDGSNQEIVEFVHGFKPRYFLTLIFRADITRNRVEKLLSSFLCKMNNSFFVRSSGDALRVLPVIEMGSARYVFSGDVEHCKQANWHIHLTIEDPTERDCKMKGKTSAELKAIIGDLWDSVRYADFDYTARSDNSEWFKEVYNIEGISSYLFKEIGDNTLAFACELANNSGKK